MVNDWMSPAAMLECLTPQWFVHSVAAPLRLASSSQKGGMEDILATRETGAASNLMTAAGAWTGTKPKLMQKQSGIGDDNQVLAMVDCFISGSSSDLNTPEIKLDDDLFCGTNTYISSDCSWEVKSETVHATNTDTVARSTIPANQVVFDLSPATPDVQPNQPEYCMDFLRLSAPGMEEGFVATGESCLALTSAPEQDLLRPQPQPSPSDFLTDIGRRAEKQVEVGIINPKITSSPALPQMSLDEACDFKIPTEILDQINKLFPDVLPVNGNISSTELDMCLGMQGDLLSGAIDQCGVLKDEIFTANEESGQPEVAMEVAHSIFPDDDIPIQVQSTSHDGITHVQNTSYEDNSQIEAQSTSHEHDLACIQAQKSPHDDITHIQAQSSSHDANHVQYLIPIIHTDNSQSIFPASKHTNGSESLATCTAPIIPPQVAPSLRSVAPDVTSTIGPVRVKRQRRSSRKPVRFRDTVTLDDPVAARDMSILVEYSDRLVKGYTTTHKKDRVSQRQLTDREKYHRIRELNNEASKRCREKRKKTMKETEEEMYKLEQRNHDLKEKEAALRKLRDKVQTFVNDFFRKQFTSK